MNTSETPRRRRLSFEEQASRAGAHSREEQLLSLVTGSTELRAAVPMEDWMDLLVAVENRLTQSVSAQPAGSHVLELPEGAGRVAAAVLECVAALGQLHEKLQSELLLRHQLELSMFDAQTALAQARAELEGTRAGESHARHLARHDELTSLPNRSYFRERLDGSLARGSAQQPFAVLYLDLDGFKAINDTHGHAAGDRLLGIVAERLRRCVRAEDMVSRVGGDEFACLLAGVAGHEPLCRLATDLFEAISTPIRLGAIQVCVRPSIGIALCPDDDVATEALLKKADEAMYRAKRAQSRYAFFGQCAGM